MQQVWAVNVSVNERDRRLRKRAGYAYVYRVYDLASDDLLYVGCTNDPRRRLREHAHHTYPREMHRFEVDVPALPQLHASNAELIQIQTRNPRDNQRLRSKETA